LLYNRHIMTFDPEAGLVAFTDNERVVMARVGGFDEPTAEVGVFNYVLNCWIDDTQEQIAATVQKNRWDRQKKVDAYYEQLGVLGSMGTVLLIRECEEMLKREARSTE
jgi:hypothetical protein